MVAGQRVDATGSARGDAAAQASGDALASPEQRNAAAPRRDALTGASPLFDAVAPARSATGLGADPAAHSSFAAIDWKEPWFAPFAQRGRRWQQAALDGYGRYLDELNADARASGLRTGRGEPLSFIAQEGLPPGIAYEAHIAATGCVPTRHNLHDFFNALTWFSYPRIKATLNTMGTAALDALGVGPTRGGVRDALTLFDENAVLFACADPFVATALRSFDWRTLFVARRDAWGVGCEVRPFGHALLEKLIAPFRACTAHAWIVDVPPAYFSWTADARDAWLDHTIAATLAADGALTPRRFAPLPVLGIPGWWADNEVASFYDDATVFRRGRRAKASDRGPC